MNPKRGVMVPSVEECFLLLRKYEVPGSVVEHSRVVQRIAGTLCRELNLQGEGLDPSVVEAASLLHDIAKVASFQTRENHSRAGARLLHELGFPEVAEIVRQHVVLDSGADHGRITEASLVHYADKRVKHTAIVSLGERFADLKERYGKSPEARSWLDALERDSRSLEERIFEKIPLRPEKLSREAG
jgi:putative nucleotidyltransferase with HDIG domain